MQSLFLQITGAWGTLCTPKSQSPSPASPALELEGFPGRAVPGCGAPQAPQSALRSPAAVGLRVSPFPAFPGLQALRNSSD